MTYFGPNLNIWSIQNLEQEKNSKLYNRSVWNVGQSTDKFRVFE